MQTKIWTATRKEFIRANASTMKDDQLAKELTKMMGMVISVSAVRQQRRLLGIKKQSGRGKCIVL